MTGVRLSLQQRERVFDRIDQRPTQLQQLLSRTSRQDDARHGSTSGASLGEPVAQVVQRDNLAALELGESGLDRGEGVGIRQDLRRLFERLVLVDRDERRGGPPMTGHDDVLATVDDVVEQASQLAPQLPHRYGLRHPPSVLNRVHKSRPKSGI